MSEHPMIFTGESVRAILDGRKSQTRRVIKPQPIQVSNECPLIQKKGHKLVAVQKQDCPYGKVGDLLWVRETFCFNSTYPDDGIVHILYKAGGHNHIKRDDWAKYYIRDKKWRPSIFMPKWAARIWLEITGIRAERVQEITKEDCIKEGLKRPKRNRNINITHWSESDASELTLQKDFMFLWNRINEKRGYGWDKNPRVWVIEFKEGKQ